MTTNIIKVIFLLSILFNILDAQENKDNLTILEIQNIRENKKQLKEIEEVLKTNIWIKRYNNYLTYRSIEKELNDIKEDAKKYGKWEGEKWKERTYQLKNKVKIKENELELISEYKDSPIGNKIHPHTIQKAPEVTNPFAIIEAYSYISQLEDAKEQYQEINTKLGEVLALLVKQDRLLKEIKDIRRSKQLDDEIKALDHEIKDFVMVVDIVSTTEGVFAKKIEQVILEVKDLIQAEIVRSFKILMIIVILFTIAVGLKFIVKKYLKSKDDDQEYTVNKIINFSVIIVSIFVLLFSYIDNASYLVTFLGFASAGIAIALKDWFMSIFGWMAIMTSGAIHVGDRIKVTKEGVEVVGDVLDISLFKISIREDVTITSYVTNRRTGRVFFIPNNYIFTDLIANYTYDNLRTVWDGIDVYITFNSNHTKAVKIAKAIANKHAFGYTELAKKRLQKMKAKYVLRSMNPEPRVFSFIEPYGIAISTWYQTNSYATLALRSKISMEILDSYLAEDDIKIAYPTQTLKVSNHQAQAEEMLPGTSGFFDAQT
jgi:small-conductance mechanosensitive channel